MRKPAPHLLRVLPIRSAEALTKGGLLVPDHKDIHYDEPNRPVHEQGARPGQEELTQHDQAHAQVHWIRHVTIESVDHELPGRVDRGQRPATPSGKLPNTRPQKHCAKPDAQEAE